MGGLGIRISFHGTADGTVTSLETLLKTAVEVPKDVFYWSQMDE